MGELVNVTRCLLCEGEKFTLFLEGKDRFSPERTSYTILRCCRCGFCFTSPRPADSELMAYYPSSFTGWTKGYSGLARWLYPLYFRMTRFLPIQKGARILEIGYGNGLFLEWMSKRGMEPYGCDPRQPPTDLSAQIRFFQGALEQARYPSEFFDAVVAWHVLEHVPNPLETFREVHRVLKQDGQLLLSVPNIEGLEYRLFRGASPLYVPLHLHHFSSASLERLLTKSDFRVEKITKDLLIPGPLVRSFFWLIEDHCPLRWSDAFLEKISYPALPVSVLFNFLSHLAGQGSTLVWRVKKRKP